MLRHSIIITWLEALLATPTATCRQPTSTSTTSTTSTSTSPRSTTYPSTCAFRGQDTWLHLSPTGVLDVMHGSPVPHGAVPDRLLPHMHVIHNSTSYSTNKHRALQDYDLTDSQDWQALNDCCADAKSDPDGPWDMAKFFPGCSSLPPQPAPKTRQDSGAAR